MRVFVKLRENNRIAGVSLQNMRNPILPDDCIDATDLDFPENFSTEYHRYVFENGSFRLETDAEITENDFPDEDYWNRLRRDRNQLLQETDWTQAIDSPLNDAQKQAWKTYRSTLRSLPENTIDPRNPTWPQKPS